VTRVPSPAALLLIVAGKTERSRSRLDLATFVEQFDLSFGGLERRVAEA
jgi:hypothetical protein